MLDSGIWQTTKGNRICILNIRNRKVKEPCFTFSDHCSHAFEFLKQEDYANAFKYLNVSMSMAGDMIRSQHPLTWTSFCNVLSAFWNRKDCRPIFYSMLKHFAAITAVVLDRGHPFSVLFDNLLHTERTTTGHNLHLSAKVATDIYAQKLGKFSSLALNCQVISANFSICDKIDVYSRLGREIRDTLGSDDFRYWATCLELAGGFLSLKEYQKSAELAETVINHTAAAKWKFWRCRALAVLATAQNGLCKTTLAERHIREAISFPAKRMGFEAHFTLRNIFRLGHWLEAWGRAEEAASIRIYVEHEITSQFDSKRKDVFKNMVSRMQALLILRTSN